MGIISVLNEMRLEQQSQNLISFGTSKLERLIGFLMVMAGLGLFCYMIVSKYKTELAGFCLFSFVVACLFCLIGMFLLTTKKYVVIDKVSKHIEIDESCFLCGHCRAIHFDEIVRFELTKSSHNFLFQNGCWVVRAYIKQLDNPFITERIFHSKSYEEAKKIAKIIAIICGCDLYDNSNIKNVTVAKKMLIKAA